MKIIRTLISCIRRWNPFHSFSGISGRRGFALMEIILMLVIIGIIASNMMMLQRSSWKTTGSSNHLLIAGQMIERQIEELRMFVDNDPENNFPPEDGTLTENGITLSWEMIPVTRTVGTQVSLNNVRKCNLTASWGTGSNESLSVLTYLSKNF
jgi:Tfp pilus assembly protein PilV